MAGEYAGNPPPGLRAVAAVSPSMDLAACVDALEERRNRIYQIYFVRRLLNRFRAKVRQCPEIYSVKGLAGIRTVREFDQAVTAPYCGFLSAADYYARASAQPLLAAIRLPTLLLTAQDDTLIPFASFADSAIRANPRIELETPQHGGHCGFVSSDSATRFWAEARVVDFFRQHSQLRTA
jgi:uncharacterized protein